MITNEYGQVTFSEQEILDMLYAGQSIDDCVSANKQVGADLFTYFGIPQHPTHSIISQPPIDYHHTKSSIWAMPLEYKNMNIEKYLAETLVEKGLTSETYMQRLLDELEEFETRNMINVLKFLCYLMDTCKQENIVTGIGRGSSVSSLVLHLLDVHKIDPVKYNLNYKEFLR